eukprot:tig00000194_g14784.t1
MQRLPPLDGSRRTPGPELEPIPARLQPLPVLRGPGERTASPQAADPQPSLRQPREAPEPRIVAVASPPGLSPQQDDEPSDALLEQFAAASRTYVELHNRLYVLENVGSAAFRPDLSASIAAAADKWLDPESARLVRTYERARQALVAHARRRLDAERQREVEALAAVEPSARALAPHFGWWERHEALRDRYARALGGGGLGSELAAHSAWHAALQRAAGAAAAAALGRLLPLAQQEPDASPALAAALDEAWALCAASGAPNWPHPPPARSAAPTPAPPPPAPRPRDRRPRRPPPATRPWRRWIAGPAASAPARSSSCSPARGRHSTAAAAGPATSTLAAAARGPLPPRTPAELLRSAFLALLFDSIARLCFRPLRHLALSNPAASAAAASLAASLQAGGEDELGRWAAAFWAPRLSPFASDLSAARLAAAAARARPKERLTPPAPAAEAGPSGAAAAAQPPPPYLSSVADFARRAVLAAAAALAAGAGPEAASSAAAAAGAYANWAAHQAALYPASRTLQQLTVLHSDALAVREALRPPGGPGPAPTPPAPASAPRPWLRLRGFARRCEELCRQTRGRAWHPRGEPAGPSRAMADAVSQMLRPAAELLGRLSPPLRAYLLPAFVAALLRGYVRRLLAGVRINSRGVRQMELDLAALRAAAAEIAAALPAPEANALLALPAYSRLEAAIALLRAKRLPGAKLAPSSAPSSPPPKPRGAGGGGSRVAPLEENEALLPIPSSEAGGPEAGGGGGVPADEAEAWLALRTRRRRLRARLLAKLRIRGAPPTPRLAGFSAPPSPWSPSRTPLSPSRPKQW